ncbi:MAG: glycoside hydrolase family 27 protein, partial [Spirochaetaceae bacterium]|nr:glycoside hydrolase family 27 protein [Spirochaetaceae bacterium]
SDENAGTRDEHQYIPFSRFCIDEYSRQIPAPNRFPSSRNGAGFAPLAEYIHSLGLKFGIHIMRGIPRFACHEHLPIKTHDGRKITADMIANPASISKWNPDMYGVNHNADGAQDYYDSLFELYASWGVDFVKVDDICNTNMYPNNPYSAEKEIEMISSAIEKCGRPIVLSLSPGPAVIEKAWHLEKYANMWRITDDFWDSWPLLKAMFERCEVWQNHVSPGCWPDCDMLPVGKIGACFKCFGSEEHTTNLTRDEQLTLMNLWCIFRSPLMIGAELTKLDDFTLSLLTNDEVLALTKNQAQAKLVSRSADYAVWATRATSSAVLGAGAGDSAVSARFDANATADFYVALFNLSDDPREVSVSLEEVRKTLFSVSSTPCANAAACARDATCAGTPATFTVCDLWQHKETGTVKSDEVLSAKLAPHASLVVRLTEER